MPAPAPRHLSMSSLKEKILQPAQTSVYLVNVVPAKATGLQGFFNQSGRKNNFNLTTDAELLNLSCCEASLPGSGLATHEVTGDFHGVTEKMAYRRIYDDSIDLTFYVDHNYKVLEFFETWMNYIVGEGSTFPYSDYLRNNAYYRMNYPDNYRCEIFLTKFEKLNVVAQPVLSYTFVDAFPINVSSIPISYDASELLKVTVSFSYTRYNRVRELKRNSSYSGEASRNQNATNPGLQFNPLSQAAFNSPGNPELAQFANPSFGVDPGGLSGIDFGLLVPADTQGNRNGTPYAANLRDEGSEIIDAVTNRSRRVEEGLPFVGRNRGPIAPFI